MNTLFASFDTGNALCKAVRANETIVFPNLIAPDDDNIMHEFTGFSSRDPLIVEIDGGRWAVGHSAADFSRNPTATVGYARYDSPDYRVLVAGLLAETYPLRGGTVALTFSLPVDAFHLAGQQSERLAGEWSFRARGRNLNYYLPYEFMTPVPESFGSLCWFLLSDDGTRIVDLDLAESRVAVVDVGGYTVDILTFRELEMTPVFGSVERGVLQIRAEINKAIKTRYNRDSLDVRDIERIMLPANGERNFYTHAGYKEDVTDIVERAIAGLVRGVQDIWTGRLNSGIDYDYVIFTGGGASVLRPYLERHIQHRNILRVDDRYAHLANAVGAWRFNAFRRANT